MCKKKVHGVGNIFIEVDDSRVERRCLQRLKDVLLVNSTSAEAVSLLLDAIMSFSRLCDDASHVKIKGFG